MITTTLITWLILIYALLVIVGGVMGYVNAGSQVSLVSGLSSGAALLIAWMISLQSPRSGFPLAALFAIILVGIFAARYRRTRKMVPAGALAIVSLVAAIVFAVGWILVVSTVP